MRLATMHRGRSDAWQQCRTIGDLQIRINSRSGRQGLGYLFSHSPAHIFGYLRLHKSTLYASILSVVVVNTPIMPIEQPST